MEWGYQLNQTENHEYYLILNCEWHVVERQSARENQWMHLRRGDWGRPRLAGRGQKNLPGRFGFTEISVCGRQGVKNMPPTPGGNVDDACDAELRVQLEREGKFEGRGGGCRRGEQDGRKKGGESEQD